MAASEKYQIPSRLLETVNRDAIAILKREGMAVDHVTRKWINRRNKEMLPKLAELARNEFLGISVSNK